MARRTSPATVVPAASQAPVPDDFEIPDEDWAEEPEISTPATAVRDPQSRSIVVEAAAHGQRLDVFLVGLAPEFSRSHLKQLIEDGCVELDGRQVTTASRKVLAGQRASVILKPTAQSQAFVPESMSLDIVFEDEHLLVVNKPAGLVVHPAAGNWTGTLMNGLLAHHAAAVELPRAGIVHRLDKDTSGLMVVGKSLVAVTALTRAIAAREVSRQYLALVHGVVDEAFSVTSSIGRDPATRVKMAVLSSGKPARTDVKRLIQGVWGPPAGAGRVDRPPARAISGVLCTLHTGRTHQIRVHLSSRRHPLVADALYGGAQALGMSRQALHATRLAFHHPVDARPLVFEAALPPDMAHAWATLAESPNRD